MNNDQISQEIKSALSESLRVLALQMQDVSEELYCYGGFEAAKHSNELSNAAHLVMDWADGISEDSA